MVKCEECGQGEGIITFCNSVLDYTHGFKASICRRCYIDRIEKQIKLCNENLEEQKMLLSKE